jgi:hypothetical protein
MAKAILQKYGPEQVKFIRDSRQDRLSWLETRDRFNVRFNSNRTIDSLRSRLYLDRKKSERRERSHNENNKSLLSHGVSLDTGSSPVPHASCGQIQKARRVESGAIDDPESDGSVHGSHVTDKHLDAASKDDDTDSDDDSGFDDDDMDDDDLDVGYGRANEVHANGAEGTSLQENIGHEAQHSLAEAGATSRYVVWEDI